MFNIVIELHIFSLLSFSLSLLSFCNAKTFISCIMLTNCQTVALDLILLLARANIMGEWMNEWQNSHARLPSNLQGNILDLVFNTIHQHSWEKSNRSQIDADLLSYLFPLSTFSSNGTAAKTSFYNRKLEESPSDPHKLHYIFILLKSSIFKLLPDCWWFFHLLWWED